MAEETQTTETTTTEAPTAKSTADRMASAAAKLEQADAKAAPETSDSKVEEKKAEQTPDEKLRSERLAAQAKIERKRKEEVRARQAELEQREAALSEREKKIAADEDYWRSFASDPVTALKSRGIEKGYAEIANILLAHELGDAAPKELRSQMEQVRRAREIEARLEKAEAENRAWREQIERERREAEERQARETALSEVGAALEAVSEVPHLARLIGKDRSRAIALVLDVASDLAQQGEEEVTIATAAAHAEARLREHASTWADLYAPPKSQPRNAEESKPAVSTLSNRATATPTSASRPRSREERMKRAVEILEKGTQD